jgi:hypothetical protein
MDGDTPSDYHQGHRTYLDGDLDPSLESGQQLMDPLHAQGGYDLLALIDNFQAGDLLQVYTLSLCPSITNGCC